MKYALTRSASMPIARSTSEISNSEVGHTSGQCVKPKKISVGFPCRFFSVTVCPAWSVSRNGPPIAAGAVTPRKPPSNHSTTTSPTTRLEANAATTTSGRVVRSIIDSLSSETGGDARGDHLEKDCGSVVDPQHCGAEQNGRDQNGAAGNDPERHPAKRTSRRRRTFLNGPLVRRIQHSFQ